eukprot:scaffold2544_cov245-Pinguiococcus_pyrenoidosus.AAC.8
MSMRSRGGSTSSWRSTPQGSRRDGGTDWVDALIEVSLSCKQSHGVDVSRGLSVRKFITIFRLEVLYMREKRHGAVMKVQRVYRGRPQSRCQWRDRQDDRTPEPRRPWIPRTQRTH